MRKLLLTLFLIFCLAGPSLAAPCYGTKMPERNKFFGGFQYYNIFKRYLEDDYGKMRSEQDFFLLSYGVFDWLSIDLKCGAGNIKQRPPAGENADYVTNFAGGYGLRLKLFERQNLKLVFGFQHISVHPESKHLGSVKNKAILDDWQTSLLTSYAFKKITPYLGTRWSRIDYIHTQGDTRKRKMSDMTKDIGLIAGLDFALTEKVWLNLEGSAFDSEALAFSVNFIPHCVRY